MRDLDADEKELDRLCREMPEWVGGTMRESDLAILCRHALPWYIAEVKRLRAELERQERPRTINDGLNECLNECLEWQMTDEEAEDLLR